MLEKIAIMDAGVIRALLVALVGLLGLVLSFFGVDEAAFGAQASRLVDGVLLLITAAGVFHAAWSRATKPTPPLTEKAVAATEALQKKQGGFIRVRLSFQMAVATLAALAVMTAAVSMQGCVGTRQAYSAAQQSPDAIVATAGVVAEHYAAVLEEAAQLKETGQVPPVALEAIRKADNAVRPLIIGGTDRPGLRQLVENYQAVRSASTQAELQAAVNAAVVELAKLINAVKAARR